MASVKRKRQSNSIRNLYGAIASIKDNIQWLKDVQYYMIPPITKAREIARHERALKELQYPKNQKAGYTQKDPQWNEIVPYNLR